jgi:predicted enzyme related to lactoylglutathione lyase
MKSYVGSVVIDVNDVASMRGFWEGVLGYRAEDVEDDWVKLCPPDRGVNVSLQLVPEPRSGKNRLHLDLYSSDPDAEVERIVALGATVVADARADGEDFTVLADPEGNLFCVIDKSPAG